jgi:hypothetical protein
LVEKVRITTAITTAAWTALVGSTSADVNHLDIFNGSGEVLKLSIDGGVSDNIFIPPGGNGLINLQIASGSDIRVRAVSADTVVGDEFVVNFFS